MAESEIPQDVRELARKAADEFVSCPCEPTYLTTIIERYIMLDRAARAPDPSRDGVVIKGLPKDAVYYLGSIMGNLSALQAIIGGPTIGSEVVADNIDWLGDFIEFARTALAPSVEAGPTPTIAENAPVAPSPHKGEPGKWDNARINDWMGRHDLRLSNPAYDELRAALASPPPVAEGMVTVPRVPTDELLYGMNRWTDEHAQDADQGYSDAEMAELYALVLALAATPNQADGAGE